MPPMFNAWTLGFIEGSTTTLNCFVPSKLYHSLFNVPFNSYQITQANKKPNEEENRIYPEVEKEHDDKR